MKELPCIACGKELESALPGDATVNQPHGGTVFWTSGHYGSTVFDPMRSGVELEITVCDECLVKHRSRVYRKVRVSAPKHDYEPWTDDRWTDGTIPPDEEGGE